MKYTVYKITNTINNKIYIGVHQTVDVDDNYMSSSKIVSAAITKYGTECFIKEILYYCDTPEDMYLKEAELVNAAFVGRDDTYNIKEGGVGGWGHWNNGCAAHIAACSKGSAPRKGVSVDGPFKKNDDRTRELSQYANEVKAQKIADNPDVYKESYKLVSEHQLNNNSMKNKCWCVPKGSTSYNEDKKVFDIAQIPYGWIRNSEQRDIGKRKSGQYGNFWIYNPKLKENRCISGEIPIGWLKGRKMEYYRS